jgi:2-methylcitrate dehydratase PrpD
MQAEDRSGASERSPSAELAAFVSTLSFDDVPPAAVETAERCFVDTVGVTLAGIEDDAGECANATFADAASGDGADVSVLGTDRRASLLDAAFVNGTAGHSLDYDDVSGGMSGHPSVPMVAPILAVAERDGCSGADAVTAFVAGFETECYLAAPVIPSHYERGWHATAVFGTFGAAAAVASLLDLDAERTRHAINAAASMPAGIKRNMGTMTKPVHVGQAARSGATAALLAANGSTAADDAVAGHRGFWDIYSGSEPPDPDAAHALGDEWAIVDHGVGVKKYPCCYFAHTAIAASAALVEAHGIDPTAVEAVHVTAAQATVDALEYADPRTPLEAKFSMEYTVARSIACGTVGLDAFTDDALNDELVQRVRERVTLDLDSTLPYSSKKATVSITTTDGDEYARTLADPPGSADSPLSDAELREKFVACAREALPDDAADEAYRRVAGLGSVDDVRAVAAALSTR